MKICVGGTFSPLHKGHKELLRTALHTAGPHGSVFIGLTSSPIAQKKGDIASFHQRKKYIKQFLEKEAVSQKIIIRSITDRYGPTLTGDFDAIVVSPETEPTAKEINQKRSTLGKTPLQIIIIPFVLSEEGRPISSSRIRGKEIDENGKRLT
jgi:pantetheine-phosphate adenylyltransferase